MSSPEIDQIKEKLDIVEVVRKSTPGLKKAGRNYKGLCPFHNEKTPSFMVNPDIGIYKCFGCGEGGDVISFIQKTERLEFREALERAAEMAGVQLPSRGYRKDPQKERRIKRLKEINKLSAQYYHYLLAKHKVGTAALKYAQNRQIDDATIEKYQLGYAPNGDHLTKFLQKKDFQLKHLIEAGVTITKRGKPIDKFRDRLVFPIFSLRGEVVGFSGRTLQKDGIPKFLNSPETEIYRKREMLYGFYQGKDSARKLDYVILFEGNVDVLSSSRLDVENVACPLGTALTIEQLKICKRYCQTVYFCFDTDTAGQKALLRGIELAEQIGLQHKAIDIGDYQDADELMCSEPKKWKKAVNAATNSVELVLKRLDHHYDLSTADGKLTFRDRAVEVLKLLTDKVEVKHFVQQVAKMLDVEEEAISSELKTQGKKRRLAPQEAPEPEAPGGKLKISKKEVLLLALLLQVADVDQLKQLQISPEVFANEYTREIYNHLQSAKKLPLHVGELAGKMRDKVSRKILEYVIMIDIPHIPRLDQEIQRVYTDIKRSQLQWQILQLQKKLDAVPDDEDAIAQFAALTKELSKLNKKPQSWPQVME